MGRDELSTLLAELVEDLDRPTLAARAWHQARRIRRRRAAIAVATVFVLVALLPFTLIHRSGSPTPAGPPEPAVTGSPGTGARVDVVPTRIEPQPPVSPFWPAHQAPPANAVSLHTAPQAHPVQLFHPDGAGPVYAYGERPINGGSGSGVFGWVVLDVGLTETRDADGNQASPLDQGSLGPLGERAAFAQPDAVVIVDLRAGTAESIPLPGLNEEVTWYPDGQHLLVSSASRTWLVRAGRPGFADAGVVGEVAVPGSEVAQLVSEDTGLVTMAARAGGPPVITRWDDEGRGELSRQSVNPATIGAYRIDALAPRGWRSGGRIAQAASGQAGNWPGDFVLVVDTGSGAITNVLDLRSSGVKGCCAVLGWQNPDTVVVRTTDDVLLWSPSTGRVTQAMDNHNGLISLAPNGCGWRITVDGSTAACIA
jgi:hypothetical protein